MKTAQSCTYYDQISMDWRPVGRVNFNVSNGYLHKKSSDISLGMQFYSLDKAPNMVKSSLKHSKNSILFEKGGESNYRNRGKPAFWSANGSIGIIGLSQPTLDTSWVKNIFRKNVRYDMF